MNLKRLSSAVGVIGLLFLCVVAWKASFGGRLKQDEEASFGRFFKTRPVEARVLEYGHDRTTLGDGSYALVFSMPEDRLQTFLQEEGFRRVDAQSNPNIWRLDLVNSIANRLLRTNIAITGSFSCYEKETDETRARVFHDNGKTTVLFLGFGRYPR